MNYDNYVCDNQMTLFDFTRKELAINSKIRLIELFSGYGSQYMALKRLGADVESYKTSEWNVHSVKMYHEVHMPNNRTDYASKEISDDELADKLFEIGISGNGKEPMTLDAIKRKSIEWQKGVYNDFRATHNLGSITNIHGSDLEIVDVDKYFYFLFYSFPCQDLSVAGSQKGYSKADWESGNSTRSGMLWEVERILKEIHESGGELPQCLMMENVPQVNSAANGNDKNFQIWKDFLESLGYVNYFNYLNAFDYGLPQSRERAFMVSILGDYNYKFPKAIDLRYSMANLLDDDTNPKYDYSNERTKTFIDNLIVEDDE